MVGHCWAFQLRACLIYLPCSLAWFPPRVQIHVFISNKANSHCDKFCCCSDALIQSLAGCQLHQQTALSVHLLFFLSLPLLETNDLISAIALWPPSIITALSLPCPPLLLHSHLIPCFLHTLFHYRFECGVTRARCLFCSVLSSITAIVKPAG